MYNIAIINGITYRPDGLVTCCCDGTDKTVKSIERDEHGAAVITYDDGAQETFANPKSLLMLPKTLAQIADDSAYRGPGLPPIPSVKPPAPTQPKTTKKTRSHQRGRRSPARK